jgi:hypothetical protein
MDIRHANHHDTEGAVPHHLEVLGVVPGRRTGIVEGMCKTYALDRRLAYTFDNLRRLNSQAF